MNERNKAKNMKTNLLSAILTAVATLTISTTAYAQYKAVSDDSIAASPKVRQMLNERKASAPAAAPAMACSKCADVRSVKLIPQAKGVEIMTGTKQVTYSHGCGSCDTKLTVAGEGKAKHEVATHTCAMDIASTAGCCASK
jgi:hypothetical protein